MHGKCIEIEFENQIYKLWPESKNKGLANYFRCFKRELGVDYLHREVWKKHNGRIPEGYEVHHKDENSLNNEIENLELITIKEHKKKHSEESRKRGLLNVTSGHMEKIRHLTKEWHASEEGLEWHRENGKRVFGKDNRQYIDGKCQICSSIFKIDTMLEYKTKFCSNNCKSEFRRRSGVDNVECNCGICGETFVKNKYSKKFLCSRKCSGEYRKKGRGL